MRSISFHSGGDTIALRNDPSVEELFVSGVTSTGGVSGSGRSASMLRMLWIASRRLASAGEMEIVKPLMASKSLIGLASIFAAFRTALIRL